MQEKISVLMSVLRRPFYGILSIVASIALAIIYYYLTLSIMPIPNVLKIAGPLYIAASLGMTFATAILAGITISIIVFKIRGINAIAIKPSGSSTAFGSTLAAFTPGCPYCSTPLLAVLGTAGTLTLFPLWGLELKLISIGALTFALYWILRSLQRSYRIKHSD